MKPIVFDRDVYIGGNSIILPGVTIGSRRIAAAGSVVSRSVLDNSVVAGVPERVAKSLDEYSKKAMADLHRFCHASAREKEKAPKEYSGVC